MPRQVVISVHGLNTRGEWQKSLAPALAMVGLVPVPLDYGWFAFGMGFSFRRNAKVRWLRNELDRVRRTTGIERPSVVCHSFGSWLIGELMRQYDDVRLDSIICAGSILPRDYEWQNLLSSGRLLAVRNEVATRDSWPRRAACIPFMNGGRGGFGTSGSEGFTFVSDLIDERVQDIDHSDAFYECRFEDWCSWLKFPRMPPEAAEGVEQAIALVHQDICEALDWDPLLARASLWAPSGEGHLIVPIDAAQIGLTQEELELRIPVGSYAVGTAFSENRSQLLEHPIALTADAPALRVVAAAPLRAKEDGHLIGVFAFDSIDMEILQLDEGSKRALQSLVSGAADSVRDVYQERTNGC